MAGDVTLPTLRQELQLYEAPVDEYGAPCWTLHDPAANKFYRIGWTEFEILSRWQCGNGADIIALVNRQTTLTITTDDVMALLQFLHQHHLLKQSDAERTEALMKASNAGAMSPLMWLLKNYLFLKIPLARPDHYLARLLPHCQWLFTHRMLKIIMLMGVIGLFLIMREWDSFMQGFRFMLTPTGLLSSFLAIAFAKAAHEMAHALTAKQMGCHVPTMGVALLVLFPMLWTETSDAWKLKEKHKRVAIDAAGMSAELGLAALASILWVLLPDGALRSVMHVLASTGWLMTLAVNLNPLMRFDGYHLLADMTDTANLQDRSFALAKHHMRRILFGINVNPPEPLPTFTRRWMILYAYATWVYRFFLFLGIALVVYHLFFKALGVCLMIVEVVWFILRPIWNEVKLWKPLIAAEHGTMKRNVAVLIALFALLIIPLSRHIAAPAIMYAASETELLVSEAAQLKEVHVTNGQAVQEGDPLFTLISPELEKQLTLAQQDAKTASLTVNQASVTDNAYSQATLAREEQQQAEANITALKARMDALIVTAPHDGVVQDIPNHLQRGNWLKAREALGIVQDTKHVQISAYIEERDILRIADKPSAEFYASDGGQHVSASLLHAGTSAISRLTHTSLASMYGGDVAVLPNQENGLLVPEQALYHYRFTVSERDGLSHIEAGTLRIEGKPTSLIASMWQKLASIIIREMSW